MKPVYLSCFLLASLGSSSYAQLPVDSVLDLNQIQDQVQDQVQDQIINSGVIENQVIDSQVLGDQLLGDVLGGDILAGDTLGAGALDQDLISGTLGELDEAGRQVRDALAPLGDAVPLDALAKTLPILTRTGETAFVDVEVENGWRAVEREWLIMLDKTELKLLSPLQADIIEQTDFAELDMVLVRFRVPAQWDSAAALKQHLPNHLHEQLDRNHIYAAQAAITTTANNRDAQLMAVCDVPVKIGMVDTAINREHSAFAKSQIIARDFLGEKFTAPRAHGTAVAGLLVGGGELQALLPNATLYAASVFYPRNQYAQGATMMDLVRALNWLAGEKVSAINMSLAGPDNQILRTVIARIAAHNIALIAAAGNEGPAAPPMYPAAYADVIAVTAVDRAQKIYRWANRGDHIDFAALGVSVKTARSDGGFGRETGTSIATPLVSAFVVCEVAQANNSVSNARAALSKTAIDLGAPGRDPMFGFGLLDATQSVEVNNKLESHSKDN
ncbi:S8 family serine peptidase [Cellvibrio sp. OA-2007]|uniref:S8 family serine peptidase n=1 Tax=Cellvibrio sp. OA-2007 TaxID=529823 RepID=UPI0007837B8B|nr:S8 family serine peptidase [Cellvibrio sp. OA-2007]